MAIHLNNIKKVEEEVKRFSKAAALAKQRLIEENAKEWHSGFKETGALKRAAQDLKRCLTDNLS